MEEWNSVEYYINNKIVNLGITKRVVLCTIVNYLLTNKNNEINLSLLGRSIDNT